MKSGVFLLKPSIRELREDVGAELTREAEQVAAARGLVTRGVARNVLVSKGSEGALLVSADDAQRFAAVEVPPGSGVGAGDAMLAEFGRRLRRALRHADVPARTGGHEFAALLQGEPDAQALQPLAQRIMAALQGPLQWQGHVLELRCRHGAACWSEAQGRLDDLRALADRRLRAAHEAQPAGPWISPLPAPPRPPSTRSRASDRG